jgi:hypothetical protein
VTRTAKTAIAVALIIGTTGAVIVAGYFVVKAKRDQIIVDEHLCPINSPVKGHVAVAVDRTDRFTPQQRDELKYLINRTKRDIAVHERLSLNLITGNPEEAGSPIFDYCKPLDPESINPLIENERRQRDKWNEQFGKPLDDALEKLLQGGKSPTSPILEAIEVILWSHNFQADLPRRELVIFSDLLQHTTDHDQYNKNVPNPCVIVATPLGQRLKAKNWDNLRVVLHRWRNPVAQRFQTPQQLTFWIRLFYLLGATEVWEMSQRMPPDSDVCSIAGTRPDVPPARPRPKPKKQNPPTPSGPNFFLWPFRG